MILWLCQIKTPFNRVSAAAATAKWRKCVNTESWNSFPRSCSQWLNISYRPSVLICSFNSNQQTPVDKLHYRYHLMYQVFCAFPHISVSLSSLPSSMSSLKVQLALSFLTTELPRGCGRCALSITPSFGKNWFGLRARKFLFNIYQCTQTISRCTASIGTATLKSGRLTLTCSSLHKAHVNFKSYWLTSDAHLLQVYCMQQVWANMTLLFSIWHSFL